MRVHFVLIWQRGQPCAYDAVLPPSCLKEGRRPVSKDGGGPMVRDGASRLLTMRPGEPAQTCDRVGSGAERTPWRPKVESRATARAASSRCGRGGPHPLPPAAA